MSAATSFKYDAVVIGGFGHVGLPLALALAKKGKKVCSLDINAKVQEIIRSGQMPFVEERGEETLKEVLAKKTFDTSLDPAVVSQAAAIVIIIGTPVDKHLNPEFESMKKTIESYMPHFRDGQLVVLRSTVYPGTSQRIQSWFGEKGKNVHVSFCPERIAEGVSLRELEEHPQIISSFSEEGLKRTRDLFGALTDDILVLSPLQAELAKLFTNVWRYVKFATANQFYMIAESQGVNFHEIHTAMTHNYPRAKDFPRPGFAAGPCLFKDTMQLASFNNNIFYLGHAAMLVNEGLPNYVVSRLKQQHNLRDKVVGILGMAFKADIDDPRESLSYKLRSIFAFESRKTLCSDAYIKAPDFVTAEQLVSESDIIVLGAPHKAYKSLKIPKGKIVVDIWNFWDTARADGH